MKSILVTGGLGYIGSHTAVELLADGWSVVIVDNLENSDLEVLDCLESLVGLKIPFVRADVRDTEKIRGVLVEYDVDSVVHFAGLKSVAESVRQPERYYDTNVRGTKCVCAAMDAASVNRIVFSSSATVYGQPQQLPIPENHATDDQTNPYGKSKATVERYLQELAKKSSRWRVAVLRYFNPIGAHPSGRIGESPRGEPNNLMPYIGEVALGRRSELIVFGDDYETPDGTGVRDYVHVRDLARGHVSALRRLEDSGGFGVWNLGTGKGSSVMDVVSAFERASGLSIPVKFGPRRPGDIAASWCDPGKAAAELDWRAEHTLDEMAADTWRWLQARH